MTKTGALRRIVDMSEEMSGIGYWRIDARRGAVTLSPQAVRIYGLDPERGEFELVRIIECYHADDRPILFEHLEAALLNGAPFSYELRLGCADGEARLVSVKGDIEKQPNGRTIIFGALMDVTETRRAEAALKASETQYRLFADNATDMIMMTDLEGRLTYISPSVARATGVDRETLMGRVSATLVHPEDGLVMKAASDRLIAGTSDEVSPRIEYRARHSDGRWLWFETRMSLLCDPVTGKAAGTLDVVREITARKTLEAQLREKMQEAEAATVAKSEFLANMSHEIRTPLTAILGFTNLMHRIDDMPDEAIQHLQRISTAGEVLLAVVNDVLDFSKLDAGQLELDPQPFDPARFMSETLDLVATQAQTKQLNLTMDVDPALPAAISADAGRLRQVMLNLLGNALKFTREGGVHVQVEYTAEAGGELKVCVTDTGDGVPPDRLDRLFQRFSQVDGSVSRQHGGTGLGLAICRSLTELMGGRIGVRSVEGQGSSFWFTISAPPMEALLGEVDDEAFVEMRPSRILVVDDVLANRVLIRAMLTPFEHEITEGAHGAEAVAIAQDAPFDLILMDLQMPGMDGWAASRAIRAADGPNRRTPIIAISANVLSAHVDACAAAGMNDHIPKPIDMDELLNRVAFWSTYADQGDADAQSEVLAVAS